MSLQIKQINPNIGAVIDGIDLNQVNESLSQDIHDALLQYQVIFFRGQQLTAPSQVQLAKLLAVYISILFIHLWRVHQKLLF